MDAEEKHFQEKIRPVRAELWMELDLAVSSLDQAVKKLSVLASDKIFDVEYEGGTSTEFGKYLTEAHRLAVIAKAIMPTDVKGGYAQRDNRDAAIQALMNGPRLDR